jgi:hypothetical protein
MHLLTIVVLFNVQLMINAYVMIDNHAYKTIETHLLN